METKIQGLISFLPDLMETATTVSVELQGEKEEDTKELFNQVIDGLNGSIATYLDILTQIEGKKGFVTEESINEMLEEFSKIIISKEERKIGDYMIDKMIPFLKELLHWLQQIEEE